MLKKNEIYRVKIEDLNNLGFGVAKIEGQTVFVSSAVDGDDADIRIILVHKTYAVARLEKLHTPSSHRIAPACGNRACGGCAYQNISYEHEKALKENYVRHAFRKAGIEAEVLPLLSAEKTERYRNKAQYAVGADKEGRCIAGFFAPKSHRLAEAADCLLQDNSFPPIVKTVLAFANANGIPPYNEETGSGVLRHIYLRASSNGKVLLTLVINAKTLPHQEKLIALLKEKHPEIVGAYLNIHTAKTNVICSDTYVWLYGEKALRDTLAGVPLSLSAAAFYQVNHAATELLYRRAKELAELSGKESLLDLYCGVGSIGLSMAKDVRELVGVEIVPEAVECAKENALKMGLTNAHFFTADAGDATALFKNVYAALGESYRPDIIILDPPRKGSTPQLLSYIADVLQTQKIVYISCNPDTLARDARLLLDKGYVMSAVTPVDLFPRTGHVESVCLLSKLNTKQHIEINLDMDELDLTDAEKKATYQEIKDYVLEHSGLKVSSLYIAQVKQTCGIIERENYNKPKSEDAKQPQCPPDKEKAIKEALKHFGMI